MNSAVLSLQRAAHIGNKTSIACTYAWCIIATPKPAVQKLLLQISPSGCGRDNCANNLLLRDRIMALECGMIKLSLAPITWDDFIPDAGRNSVWLQKSRRASLIYDVV